jgi:hypothetical protein
VVALIAGGTSTNYHSFLEESDSRIISIPFLGMHPNSQPRTVAFRKFEGAGIQRKFVATSTGLYEIQKAVPTLPRSWFIGQSIYAGKYSWTTKPALTHLMLTRFEL